MFYLVKTPWLVKKLVYPDYVWSMPKKEKNIYLSFDDGPHPTITNFVLDQLKQFNAKASFFCIGKNVLTVSLRYTKGSLMMDIVLAIIHMIILMVGMLMTEYI